MKFKKCVILLISLLTACGSDPAWQGGDDPFDDSGKNDQSAITDITLTTGNLIPAFSKDVHVYEVKSLNTMTPIGITVKTLANEKVYLNGKEVPSNKIHSFQLDTLSVTDYITVVDASGQNRYSIRTLPESYPEYRVDLKKETPGDIYFSSEEVPATILSPTGAVKYYRQGESFDFKKVYNSRGQERYILIDKIPDIDNPVLGTYKCSVRIFDRDFYEIGQPNPVTPVGSSVDLYSDNHDFIYIDDDDYVFSLYTPQLVENVPAEINPGGGGRSVIAAHIQRVRGGKVVWEWYSTDHPEFYATSIAASQFSDPHAVDINYMHMNSIEIDPEDGNIVCSFRNQGAVVKIGRRTGDVLWILGGEGDQFGLTPEQKFVGQHDARVHATSDPRTVLVSVFDNNSGGRYARVAEYLIDQRSKQLLDFREYSAGTYNSFYMGSAQRLDDTYFICWGGYDTQYVNPSITEVSLTGEELLNIYFPGGEGIYRAYKLE